MVTQRLSPVRLLRTYTAVVGVPALALFVILRVGETIAARGPGGSIIAARAMATPWRDAAVRGLRRGPSALIVMWRLRSLADG